MKVRLQAEVTATDSEDGIVLLDQRDGRYFQLNATGAATLRLLLEGHTLEDAAAALAERAPVRVEQALADVRELLATLRNARLVIA
ncbi:lasso peptide biosynthesis PqqD family chaperone [Amycolatopsis sp. NPDC059021]|uniref:lasso peptide biosynthesis PqqD family chaperone n=1 Tax=Amycolatopsis sp. NPDC059021 TaxID=3346704 RepID=UPI00366A934F